MGTEVQREGNGWDLGEEDELEERAQTHSTASPSRPAPLGVLLSSEVMAVNSGKRQADLLPARARRNSGDRTTGREEVDSFWSPKAALRRSFDEEFERVEFAGGSEGAWSRWSSENPLYSKVLRSMALVLVWYVFSILLSLYNKFLLGNKHGRFPAPLLMTTFHFLLQFLFSSFLLKCCCTSFAPPAPPTRWDYLTKVVPSGIGTALDIGFSNLSLVLITISFYTMCKSSAPVFLLLFAFAFRLEDPSWKLAGVMTVIVIGEVLTVFGESNFDLEGFILVMLASVLAGFRWTLTQVLLQKEKLGLTNPVVTLYYMAPIMAASLGIISLATEPWGKLQQTTYFDTPHHAVGSLGLMAFGGTLAFFMILTEFMLISETSAVTFTVAGVVKEMVTIMVSRAVFGDEFGWINTLGLAVVIFGVSLFNLVKYQRMKEGKLSHAGHAPASNKAPEVDGKYVLLKKPDAADEVLESGSGDVELGSSRVRKGDATLNDVHGEGDEEEDEVTTLTPSHRR